MEVQGKIKLKKDTQSFGSAENPFLKRELIVTTDEQYPQDIMIEFVQDKCALIDSYNVGQDVKVSINLRGREWINPQGEAKYFNSIQGWRIEQLETVPSDLQQAPLEQVLDEEPDDLPF